MVAPLEQRPERLHARSWLNLLVRWSRTWSRASPGIGTSFHFIALDLSLRREQNAPTGVMGAALEVHGGGSTSIRPTLSDVIRQRLVTARDIETITVPTWISSSATIRR